MWSKGRSGPCRPLAASERALFMVSSLSPVNLVVLARLRGAAVDGAAVDGTAAEGTAFDATAFGTLLPTALAAAQARHALLRARITGPPARPRFEVSPPETAAARPGPIPLRMLRTGDAGDAGRAYAVAEAEMNAPFDPAIGPLARLTCVFGPGSDIDLILTLHHSIADGTSAATLVHELLDWCRARLAGQPPPSPAPAALPPPLSDLLPASMRGFQGGRRRLALVARDGRDEIACRLGSRGQRRPVPALGRAVTLPLDLDSGQTTTLVSRARRERLTLTSVLAAGLLWQASAVLYRGRPATMRAVIWVDLRPYLNPPVGAQTLGCYASLLRFAIRVDPGRGFAALAAAVQRKVELASRRGDRLPAAQVSAAMTRLAVRWPVRLGTVALSYAAAPAIQPGYGPVEVREVRAFVSNSRFGAELAAACGVRHGALWCDLLYLDCDYGRATAAALGDGLLATLREFAEQA